MKDKQAQSKEKLIEVLEKKVKTVSDPVLKDSLKNKLNALKGNKTVLK